MAYNAKTIHELPFITPDAALDELILWDTSGNVCGKALIDDIVASSTYGGRTVAESVSFSFDEIVSGDGLVLWWPIRDFILTHVDLLITTAWTADSGTYLSFGYGELSGGLADPQQVISAEQCLVANLADENAIISGFHNGHERSVIGGGKRHFMAGSPFEPENSEDSTRYIKVCTDGLWTAGGGTLYIHGYYAG